MRDADQKRAKATQWIFSILCLPICVAVFYFMILGFAYAADSKSKEKTAEPIVVDTPEPIVFEYVCKSEISYTWKKSVVQGNRAAAPPEAQNALFSFIQMTQASEELSRRMILPAIAKAKQQALLECQQTHQSRTICLSLRLNTLADRYDRSDYQTRKLLLESARNDCENQVGECVSTTSSDVSCDKVEVEKKQTLPIAKTPDKPAEEVGKKEAKKK